MQKNIDKIVDVTLILWELQREPACDEYETQEETPEEIMPDHTHQLPLCFD